MTFRHRIQYLLVKRLRLSNKQALAAIQQGLVSVNGTVVYENCPFTLTDTIWFENQLVQEGKQLKYLVLYKPVGIETTLNPDIPNNLLSLLPNREELFPVGRLDKASEGLLLLTNDGRIFDKTLRKEHQTEKEYWVKVDKPINQDFLQQMANGVVIMGQQTLPCSIEALGEDCFKIILVQGLNRQIRRMCYKLGYEVLILKRIRIGSLHLGDLQASEYRWLSSVAGLV